MPNIKPVFRKKRPNSIAETIGFATSATGC
jgi:hypothetical protein